MQTERTTQPQVARQLRAALAGGRHCRLQPRAKSSVRARKADPDMPRPL